MMQSQFLKPFGLRQADLKAELGYNDRKLDRLFRNEPALYALMVAGLLAERKKQQGWVQNTRTSEYMTTRHRLDNEVSGLVVPARRENDRWILS